MNGWSQSFGKHFGFEILQYARVPNRGSTYSNLNVCVCVCVESDNMITHNRMENEGTANKFNEVTVKMRLVSSFRFRLLI